MHTILFRFAKETFLFSVFLAAFLFSGSSLFGQTSPSGQVGIVTPTTLSSCNTDTIVVNVTNLQGNKGVTYTGNVTLTINIPGNGLIPYVPGSLTSIPAGATVTSYTNNVLTISLPIPNIGSSTKVKFIVQPDCSVTSISDFLTFTGQIAYPPSFPTPTESFTSSLMNVGKATLSIAPLRENYVTAFGANDWQSIYSISNTGFGNINTVKISVLSDNNLDFAGSSLKDRMYTSATVLLGTITPVTTTVIGNNTLRVYEVSGPLLGSDGILTPGETLRFYNGRITPSVCGTYDQYITFEYSCGTGTPSCDAPIQKFTRSRVSAGTPRLTGTLISAEDFDGCPDRAVVYTVKNTGTGNAAPIGNAYDVNLEIRFGGGLMTLSDISLNGMLVPPANIFPGATASTFTIRLKDLMTTDPDGPGGISDIDNDGFFDDMLVGAETTVSFNYTAPCELACGASLYYVMTSRATFTDFCRDLVGVTSSPLKTFGFQQVKAVEQKEIVDYGFFNSTSPPVTKKAKFDFQYRSHNIDLASVVGELQIRYGDEYEIDTSTIRINGMPPTNAPILAGTGATFGGTPGGSDNDSMWIVPLTLAELTILFDNVTDSLHYDQTRYSCQTKRQITGAANAWNLFVQIKSGLCTDGSTPCNFDVSCDKPFVFTYNEGCGTVPCYVQSSTIKRISPTGFTDVNETTPTAFIDSTRSYSGDTIEFAQRFYLTGDDPQEPCGFWVNQGRPDLDLRSVFGLAYTTPKGWNGSNNIWKFIPGISKVVIRERTPDPANGAALGTIGNVLFEAPILLSDFHSRNVAIEPTTQSRHGVTISNYNPITTAPYNGRTVTQYRCDVASTEWDMEGICPASNKFGYDNATSNISYERRFKADGTKVRDLYQLWIGKALSRAGWTNQMGEDNYYIEVLTKWEMDKDFPWDNSNDWNVKGYTEHYGNHVGGSTVQLTSTYNGPCGRFASTHLTVTKDHYVNNPNAVYSADCGLRVSNQVFFKSQQGDYFDNSTGEVRVPLKVDKIDIVLPSEYALAPSPNISLDYHQSGTVQTSTNYQASANTGAISFTKIGGGDFDRADDASGNNIAYDLRYDIVKVGTAAAAVYKVPIEIHTRDESDRITILYDTASISEVKPILTIAPITPILNNIDGGDCENAYFDFVIQNNTLYDAGNVYFAADGTIGTEMVNVTDGDSIYIDPLIPADISTYPTGSIFAKIGTLKAGDKRVVRLFAKTNICADDITVYTDFGCDYPTPLAPLLSSGNIKTATVRYEALKVQLLSRGVTPSLNITDLCGEKDVEIELRNANLSNIYNLKIGVKLPPSMQYLAGSGTIKHPVTGFDSTIVTVLNATQDTITFDLKDNYPFLDSCAWVGSDEAPLNDLRLKFKVSFSACPTTNVAAMTFKSIGESYCGEPQTTNLVIPVNYVGNAGTQNNYSLNTTPATYKVCATANQTQKITDQLIITNLGGFGTASGPTSGLDSVTFAIPFNTTQFTVNNFVVSAPFSNPVFGTDGQGNLTMRLAIPAGIAVNSTVILPITYDLTPNIDRLCLNASVPPLCFFAQFSSPISLGCTSSPLLSCGAVAKNLRGSGLTLRNFDCCYGSIGDYVWYDNNNDGQQGTAMAEPPVPNVKVYLWNTVTNMIVDSTTTNPMGMYLFDSLFDGSYQVQFIPPAGSILAMQNVGDDSSDNDADAMGFSQTVLIQALDPATQEPRLTADILLNNPTIDAGITPVDRSGRNPPPGENGGCHVITPDLRLGLLNEPDGGVQMVVDDGISNMPASAIVGTTLNLEMEVYNNTGGPAYLVGWIDWDGDGVLEPATEQFILQTVNTQGTSFVPLTIMIPANATQNIDLEMAFRISTLNGLLPYGEPCAPDGEYENYTLRFVCPPPVCLPIGMVRN